MKRANGTGTVVKLSGNRRRPYAVHVPGRDARGRAIQRTLSYHERAQEAQEEYNRLREAGTTPAADKLSLTVADVFRAGQLGNIAS